ncbi:MAG: hypothetical protein WCF82_01750 [Microcoleus sp.]
MYCEIGWELRRDRAKASALPGRAWELKKSQLGDGEDIKHELERLENPNYSVSANVTACWGGMKQEAIRLCGACYSESPCHKIEWQFKTVQGKRILIST